MTDLFDTYAEPQALPVLDYAALDLSEADLATVRSIMASAPLAVRAAHVYDRKGFFDTDNFAQSKRHPRGNDHDAIIVQVTMVVRANGYESDPEHHVAMTRVHASVQAAKAEADIAASEAALAASEAEVAAAQAAVEEARARLAQAQAQTARG